MEISIQQLTLLLFILQQEDAGDDKGGDGDAGGGDVKKSLRPTTARRRPPKVQDGSKEVEAKGSIQGAKKAQGILVDGAADDEVCLALLFVSLGWCYVN